VSRAPLSARLATTLHEHKKLLFDIADVKEITGLGDASARSFVSSLVDKRCGDFSRDV
jgi:hypothetical protein